MSGIGRDFVRGTYYERLSRSDQMKGVRRPPLELPHQGAAEPIPLPPPESLSVTPVDLRTAVEKRRSVRRYAPQPLAREELAFLLWCTQGVRDVSGATFRTVPSAGARHAFETFLLVNRVAGLHEGLYRYLALSHELLAVPSDERSRERLSEACFNQDMVSASAVTFVWAAVPYRMTWRYGERGYRYLYLDAGHICQNLYLSTAAVDCGVCAIAAFDDEKVDRLFGFDGKRVFTVYLATVGKLA